jgi:hypothetical protein
VAIFKKFRKALKPGGILVINDFVLNDDRTGHPFAMIFPAQMLLVTKAGNAWRQSDYRAWLKEAGFTAVEIVPTPTPALTGRPERALMTASGRPGALRVPQIRLWAA